MNIDNKKSDYGNDYQLIDNDIERNSKGHLLNEYDRINVGIRLGFVKKVYSILSLQLLMTTIMCLFSMYSKSFFQFQAENFGLLLFSILMTAILPCLSLCFNDLFRKVPHNYIFLTTFTFFESYLVSFICGATNPRIVFMAASMTFAMVLGLTLYAMTTKTDLTMQGGLLFIIGMGVLLFSLFAMFTNNKIVHVVLSTVFVILFGVYLVYDTQLILGNGELKLTVDDYILASFMLYLDIVNLFINLLQILNIISGDQ
jgi:protein lifeguard